MTILHVPPMPCIVEGGVFDAWGWCASDEVEWRLPEGRAFEQTNRVTSDNPPDLAFVMHAEHGFLPRELARLHAVGYGLGDEWALAPWAIDDATDGLYEKRVRPRDVFWIAAPSLAALVWGLHDWAHFHNHGPFDEPAMTELACDLVALSWIRGNATALREHGVGEEAIARVAEDLASLSRRRFAGEKKPPPVDDLEGLFAGPYPDRIIGRVNIASSR